MESNSRIKSRIKTFVNKVDILVKASDLQPAITALRVAESEIMKSVKSGVLKLNTASRRVSKLVKSVKALESKAA